MNTKSTMKQFTVLLLAFLMLVTFMPSMAFADDGSALKVKLSKKTLNLVTGETQTLTAAVTGDGAEEATVEWSSSEEKVATVDGGKVTAKKAGVAEITATAGEAEASCIVYVEKADAPSSIAVGVKEGSNVNKSNNCWIFSTKDGTGSFQLEATVSPTGATEKVNWTSSDKTCVIDEDGNVTVDGLMTAKYVTFTATSAANSKVSGKIQVYVLPPMYQASDVTVSIPDNGVFRSTASYAKVSPSPYGDYRILNWSAESDEFFDVNYEGQSVCYILPKAPGSTTLTATDKYNEDNKTSLKVTIKGFLIEDEEGTKNESSLEKGKALQLTAKGVNNDEITWTTEDESVATVDDKGLVTGAAEGSTTIKAAWDQDGDGTADFTAKYIVSVLNPDNAYVEKLYTTYYNALCTDTEYKNKISSEQRYTADGTVTQAHYFDITDTTDGLYYVSNNSSYIQMGAVFDKEKVKVEIVQDGEDNIEFTSGALSKVNLSAGENKFSVKVTDITGEKKTMTYNYTVVRGYNTNNGMASLTLAPSDRKAAATTEGALSPTFRNTTTDYTTTVYKGITGVSITARASDYNTAHIFYSTDGENWTDGGATFTSDKLALAEDGTLTIYVKTVSDKDYHAAKDAGTEPTDKAPRTYTIKVSRNDNIDPDTLGIVNIKKVELSDGMTWCTPEWKEGYTQSAALVNHDTDTATVTYHVAAGAKLYNGSVSAANLLTPTGQDEDGNNIYQVTTKTPLSAQAGMYTQKVVVSTEPVKGTTVTATYQMNLYKIGTTKGILGGMWDSIVDYICPASQYTSGGNQGWGVYGIFPEKINMGTGNWNSPISIGNFGGYITFKYDKAITDDPSHKYGIDFTVFGNSNGGASFSEPGNVLVSEDGKTWYTLAGSEHYDDTCDWNYTVTYKRNATSEIADYEDNYGNSESLGTGWSPYRMPDAEWYPLHTFKDGEDQAITFSGVRLFGTNGSKADKTGIEVQGNAALPAFGYVDVHKNSSSVAGTGENVNLLEVPVGDPYTSGYDGYGDGFDLKWAVDEDGNPVDSSKLQIHYVKVQTASFINGKAIGEKSTEVSAMVRTAEDKTDYGETADPEKITIGDQTIGLVDGKDVYNVVLDSADNYDVTVKASDDANVYINNKRTTTRNYDALPDKGIIRVIVQEGEAEPSIKYIHVTTKDGDADVIAAAAADKVEALIAALPEKVTASDYEQVKEARAAYEALSSDGQKKVSNLSKLEAAEEATAGAKVAEEIKALVNSDYTKKDVEKVRKDYNALTLIQKQDVTNYNELTQAERIIALESEVNQMKAKEAAKKKVTGLKAKTSKSKKLAKLSWKKVSGVNGYQVQYKVKGGKYKTLTTTSKNTTVKATVKKLKKGKKYTFKVRTYTKIDGKKIYGKWSKTKSFKIKK